MNTRSIYQQFSFKLIFATSLFVIVISFLFYGFTKTTVYEEVGDNLIKKAKLIKEASINSILSKEQLKVIIADNIEVDLITLPHQTLITVREFRTKNQHFIEVLYPFDKSTNSYIKVVQNIDNVDKMIHKIFSNVIILAAAGLILVILYALAVSKTLLFPILNITNKLSNMNENSLTTIETKKLPIEFHPLANSINSLTNKIQMYVKYQKELFIGAAHELKTPLAVMKLKSEVVLLKDRPIEKYKDTLKLVISEIDGMNSMVSSILDIGRQEGAQFEKPIEMDIIEFITNKVNNYKLLAKEKKITIDFRCEIEKFITIIQPTLINQILQNFVQNSIKFTPENKTIIIEVKQDEKSIIINIIDEGIGIDESIDLFAPFKRIGNQKGAGLGLYLAKSASDAIGANISLKNRTDGVSGTVACLKLYKNPTCKL